MSLEKIESSQQLTNDALVKRFLIGKSSQYDIRANEGNLPLALEPFRNKISWPIPATTPSINLACYFGERNYSDPSMKTPHHGIDIQVAEGTPVLSPEKTTLIYCSRPDERGLVDITLYSTQNNVL